MIPFDISGGSVPGHHHSQNNQNNQDAFAIMRTKNMIAACVCDGCGSTPYSEIGARLGSNIVLKSILQQISDWNLSEFDQYYSFLSKARIGTIEESFKVVEFWDSIKATIIGKMEMVVRDCFHQLPGLVALEHFLFTTVGFIITEKSGCVFSFGDGVWYLNGEGHTIGPFPQNAPPYLGHHFTKNGSGWGKDLFVEKIFKTKDVNFLLIGSDGCVDLQMAENKHLPGKTGKIVGPISQFWEEEKFFKNKDAIRRKLAVISNIHQNVDWENKTIDKSKAILDDDTTLVVLKRKSHISG